MLGARAMCVGLNANNMRAIVIFAFFTTFTIATCSVQYPQLTDCSEGEGAKIIDILNITVTDAVAGKTVVVDSVAEFTETVGENLQLLISLAKPSGAPVLCIPIVLPCTLNLCEGTTDIEEELNEEWNNKCPVEHGIYNARLSFDLPAGFLTKVYLGDGKVVVTFKIVDGATTYTCKSFNINFKV